MEVGQTYRVTVDMHDRNNRRLYPADNLRFHIDLPTSHFQVSDLMIVYVVVDDDDVIG